MKRAQSRLAESKIKRANWRAMVGDTHDLHGSAQSKADPRALLACY